MKELTIIVVIFSLLLPACKKKSNEAVENKPPTEEKKYFWESKAAFPGGNLSDGVSFVINSKLYVGTGFRNLTTVSLFYEYDYDTNRWKQLSSFPSIRRDAIAFSIGNYGYIGLGFYVTNVNGSTKFVYFNDLWRYDPVNDLWIQMADFPGTPRAYSTCFTINDKSYVTGGSTVGDNDMWEYNSSSNSWVKKASFPGGCSTRGISFNIGEKGYVGFGWSGSSSCGDLWEYDPISDSWSQKCDFPGKARRDSKCVSLSNFAILFCGVSQDATTEESLNDIWIYDLTKNSWSKSDTCYAGQGREGMIANVLQQHLLIGLGTNSGGAKIDELWEYNFKSK